MLNSNYFSNKFNPWVRALHPTQLFKFVTYFAKKKRLSTPPLQKAADVEIREVEKDAKGIGGDKLVQVTIGDDDIKHLPEEFQNNIKRNGLGYWDGKKDSPLKHYHYTNLPDG